MRLALDAPITKIRNLEGVKTSETNLLLATTLPQPAGGKKNGGTEFPRAPSGLSGVVHAEALR